MRELEATSGVHRSTLSLAESGRLVPTSSEYDKVMAALAAAEADRVMGARSATMDPAAEEVPSPQR